MSDNPTEVEGGRIALPGHRILALTGPDAPKFAQAQFMNDVALLGDGEWQWNGWLNAKGRLIALFALLRLDAATLWLLLPDHPPAALAEDLRKYVFRAKVKLEVRNDLRVEGSHGGAEAPAGRVIGDAEGGLTLRWPGGRLLHVVPGAPDAAPAAENPEWRSADLRAGLPRLAEAQSAQWTPQQLSLDRLAAFSVKKGCYPGQEIVARTHFLGQAKRGLRLLQADAPPEAGTDVEQAGRAIGKIASVAGRNALAVLPLEIEADAALEAAGTPLKLQAFEG